jgi:N-formylglutamate deformylase
MNNSHQDQPPFVFHAGTEPLLVSMPHVGTYLPPALAARLTVEARRVPDTDWHLDRLYVFAKEMGASILMATHSRYVVDLNRPSDNTNLYPGQSVTACARWIPSTTHRCTWKAWRRMPQNRRARQRGLAPVPRSSCAPNSHACDSLHGIAMLWDAHSIRSALPRFFEGKLPDFNLGTADGASCDPALADAVLAIANGAPGYTAVLNGRFKGGHITRLYGQPSRGVHAIQMEMAQCTYMQEQMPFDYLPETAANVQPHLLAMLQAVLRFAEPARP